MPAATAPSALPTHPWLLPALLCGSIVGAAVQVRQAQLWPVLGYAALAVGSAGLLLAVAYRSLWRQRPGWRVLLAASGAALAVLAITGLRAQHMAAQALDPTLEGRDLRVVATVVAMPQPAPGGQRLRVAVESAQLGGSSVRLPTYIDLGWYHRAWHEDPDTPPQQPTAVRAGERWALTVRLKAPHGSRNPHGFDYELWLWEQGVQATGYVRSGPRDAPAQRLSTATLLRHPIEQARQSVRDAIFARLAPDATDSAAVRTAGIIAALVTGDQRAIDRNDWEVFRTTGLGHLFSISGLHITLFAWLAGLVVQALWRRSSLLCLRLPAQNAAWIAGVLLATGYALFSGWGIPAQRTVTMLCAIAVLRGLGVRWPWPQVWLLACAVVVLPDPWALWQPGFWLSFVAVGVLFAADPSYAAAPSTKPRDWQARAWSLWREQWTVTLALTPLGVLLFGQMSLVGLGANLLAIPWLTLWVTPLSLLGVVFAPLWDVAAWNVQLMVKLLEWLAAWPWASLWRPAVPLGIGLAGVLGGVLLALRWPWQVRCLGLPLLVPLLFWQAPRPATGHFEVLAADVGQGSALLVRTAGHSLLFDAGPRYSAQSEAGERVLVPLLRALGERLDLLLLSHRDSDHIGGAAAVLQAQPQARLQGSISDEAHLHALRPASPCLAGQRWDWDGVAFEILHPTEVARQPRQQTNAQSCVLRVSAHTGANALLTGDIEAPQEMALIARQMPLQADLLVLPHHGSKTSSSAAFLDAVQPRLAIAQTGYRNRFGHPAPTVLQRLQERDVVLVNSPRCGAALWTSQQPQKVDCERLRQPRYWQHAAAMPSTP